MAILILLVFSALAWLVLILPRQRELKRHQALMGQLAVGERVMMTSGIYGVIRELEDDYAQLEIADGLCIKIAKRSIASRVEEPAMADDDSTETLGRAADSVDGERVGQTSAGEPEPDLGLDSESDHGEQSDSDDAVTGVDDEVDNVTGNEA